MKKTYKSIKAFIVLLSFATLQMGAALSGTVTINPSSPASSTNYQTFAAFATDLNTLGISGPLTVNVANATYNEQVTFNQITGMSASNRVTINGNGALLTFNAISGAPHTMLLNGTDYLTVNNLQMQGTNSTYALVCLLAGDAGSNVFTACTFSCPANCTSSSTSPFSFSGSSTGLSNPGAINNFNTITSSTLSSGYYSIYHYSSSAAAPSGNSFLNCYITDWYAYCVYQYYSKNMTFKGCQFDCLTRTSVTSTYLVYGYYAQGFDFENNIVEKVFNGAPTTTSSYYGIYELGYYNPTGQGGNPCKVINNIFRKIESNGTIYAFEYCYYSDLWIMHNTISFDHSASTSASSCYAFYYCYGGNAMYPQIMNNNVTITRGGSGAKYGYYTGGNSLTGAVLDYNNWYVNGLGTGANYIGYVTGPALTLGTWTTQGVDAHGMSMDPMYASLVSTPQDLHPTNSLLNNKATPLGIILDQQYSPRDLVTPDVGALEFGNPACTGIPTSSTVNTPSYAICSGERLDLMLNNYTSNSGINYQWVVSNQSAVGPWTVIPGANTIVYSTPPNTSNVWYGIAQTCTNAVGSKTAVGAVVLAGVTTNTAPYFESFEGIGKPNRLPNCSWSAPNIGATALTYTSSNTNGRSPRTGSSFATFYNSQTGANYFYTNSIYMTAGITYNAEVWYQTDPIGYNNWTDLSILIGTSQTSAGLTSIVSTNGPAVATTYKQLTGNFTVPATGYYNVAVRATAANGSAPYLTIDDLRISIPCSINSPTVTISANTTSVCAGDPVNLGASGATTYSWSTGATVANITDNPIQTTSYIVVGTSALSGCSTAVTQIVTVNPSPTVLVYATKPDICPGQSTSLNAIGSQGVTYSWSNNANGPSISVLPTPSNNTYTVIATNSFGCISMAAQSISIHPVPTVFVPQVNDICVGESQIITASSTGGAGGVTYAWISATGAVYQGNPVTVNPAASTVYSVTGTDSFGCAGKSTVVLNVNDCTGLSVNKLAGVSVYPNPTSGEIMVELNNASVKTIHLMDLTGRVISSSTSSLEVVKVDLTNLSNGIYYLKIQSDSSVEVVKVVKQ